MFYSSDIHYDSDSVYAFYPEYSMQRKDYYPNRAVDFNTIIEVKDKTGAVQPIDGLLEGEIVEFVGSNKNIPIRLNLVDGPNGIVELSIAAADLSNIRRRMYQYQIRIADGNKKSLISFGMFVFAD